MYSFNKYDLFIAGLDLKKKKWGADHSVQGTSLGL